MHTDRRRCLKHLGALAVAGGLPHAAVLAAPAAAAGGKAALQIYIPANPGGGWDQTGRSLGQAMTSAGLVQKVDYANKGGKGGTIGLDEFVKVHAGDPSALLVGGLVMVGALAVSGNGAKLKQLTPVARLTSDYMVLAVAADSPVRDVRMLVERLRANPSSVVFTGGSAGGVDHMLVGMIGRAVRVDVSQLQYRPTSSGPDAIEQLRTGAAQVAISGYSEFKSGFEDRSLLPLAVSSRRSLFGVPSLREQGVDTELANWRGVFAPGGLSPEQATALRQLVQQATQTPAWRQTLQAQNWNASPLFGKDFADFLEIEQGIAAAVTLMLKLRA